MSIIDPVRTRVDLTTLNLGFGTFPDVQPFSPRSAIGYQDLLESLYRYVTRDVYNFLIAASGQATWDANVDTLLAAIDTVLAEQKSDVDTEVNAAVQQIIDSTITITDPVTYAIVNDPASSTSVKLAALFGLTDQKLHDALGAVSYGALDARYLKPAASARNVTTGWFHADEFGALFDGTDDRTAIQAAVDAANARYTTSRQIQRVYLRDLATVGVTGYYIGGVQQGVCGIALRSGVVLMGPGGLKAMNGSYGSGAQYAVIRGDGGGISDAGVEDITVDGNRTGNVSSNQCNNIFIPGVNNIVIRRVKSFEANGNSIMVVGTSTAPVTDVRIEDCRVNGANTIGIQVSQFNGLVIHNNIVESTTDNGIDIYGENSGSTTSNGINFKITDNLCRFNGNGIFPETVAHGIVANNIVQDAANHSIHVNRINGEPDDILITGNKLTGSHCGVGVTGVMGVKNGLTIRNNIISGFDEGGVLMGGAGDVANVYVLDNTINGVTDQIPLVLCKAGTGTLSNFIHERSITKSKQRAYDTVNYATSTANNTWAPALSPGD